MRIITRCLVSVLATAAAAPALAQDETAPPPAITINGSVAVVSDYRFRGISQTDKEFGVQGSITVAHESGLYATVYGYSIDDYVSQGADAEIDLIGGFRKTTAGGTTFDVGVLYYYYPKNSGGNTDFVEPFASVAQTFGPVTAKASVAYAPKQRALALNQLGPKLDSVYVAGDLSAGVPGTPLSVSAHLGHTFGPSYLSIGDEYTDWSLGIAATYRNLTLGVAYVDTDAASGAFTTPSGRDAAKGGIVGSLTAAF